MIVASSIPASASHPSLRNVSSQRTTSGTGPPSLLPGDDLDHATPDARIESNPRSADSSIRNRSTDSDRPSIIRTHSRESLHTPVSQPTQFPRDPRQFGRLASVPSSREHPPRSPSPTDHNPQLPRLEIDVTDSHPQTHVHGRNSTINPSSVAFHTHTPPIPPSLHGHRRRQSSTSVVVGVVNPSTDSLILSPSTDHPPPLDEPYTVGSPIEPSCPVSDAPDASDGSVQHDPSATSLSATSNLDLPEDHILQLIHSEQIERYTKGATVQVNYYHLLSLH